MLGVCNSRKHSSLQATGGNFRLAPHTLTTPGKSQLPTMGLGIFRISTEKLLIEEPEKKF